MTSYVGYHTLKREEYARGLHLASDSFFKLCNDYFTSLRFKKITYNIIENWITNIKLELSSRDLREIQFILGGLYDVLYKNVKIDKNLKHYLNKESFTVFDNKILAIIIHKFINIVFYYEETEEKYHATRTDLFRLDFAECWRCLQSMHLFYIQSYVSYEEICITYVVGPKNSFNDANYKDYLVNKILSDKVLTTYITTAFQEDELKEKCLFLINDYIETKNVK
jgi:hypothetical protein